MSRLALKDDGSPETREFYTSYPELGLPANVLRDAVYSTNNPLPPLVREAVRMRIAVANDCVVCRFARLMPELGEKFYASIADFREHPDLYSPELQCALEFAELFAMNHLAIDDDLFDRLRVYFSEAEIAALGVSCAYFSGIGRLTRVLLLDQTCDIGGSVTVAA
ncbi:MAG: hypothetical protein ABW128_23860 [Rhizorhabdus sp.]